MKKVLFLIFASLLVLGACGRWQVDFNFTEQIIPWLAFLRKPKRRACGESNFIKGGINGDLYKHG